MSRGYRVWDNQEKTYSDKAFSIDQLGICYVQDEDAYWEEIDDRRFIVEFETGLTDKNADMICEGDIVNISGIACADGSSMASYTPIWWYLPLNLPQNLSQNLRPSQPLNPSLLLSQNQLQLLNLRTILQTGSSDSFMH